MQTKEQLRLSKSWHVFECFQHCQLLNEKNRVENKQKYFCGQLFERKRDEDFYWTNFCEENEKENFLGSYSRRIFSSPNFFWGKAERNSSGQYFES